MSGVFIVSQGDAWLSTGSIRPLDDCVAYRTRGQAAGRVIREIIALRGETKAGKDEAIRQIRELGYSQTQGLQTNFIITEFTVR